MDILPTLTKKKYRLVSTDKPRLATVFVALYFSASPLSLINLSGVGAAVKIFAVLALLAAFLDIRSFKITISPLTIILHLFWLLAIISCFFTSSVSLSAQYTVTLSLNTLLVLVLGMMEDYKKTDCVILERALLVGSWISIILTVVFSDVSAAGRLTMRIGNSSADQNGLNGYFLIAFSFHLCSFFRKNRKIHLLFAAIPLLLGVMTGSRGGILAYLMVMAAVAVVYRKEVIRSRVLNIIAVILAVVLIYFIIKSAIPDSVLERYSSSYIDQHGSAGRLETWRSLLTHYEGDNIFRLIFGHGYGTTRLYNAHNGNVAHNLYIDNLISLGIVGCLLTIVQQLVVLTVLVRNRRPTIALVYIGYIVMCVSLSLTSYLPMWNIILLTLIYDTTTLNGAKRQ